MNTNFKSCHNSFRCFYFNSEFIQLLLFILCQNHIYIHAAKKNTPTLLTFKIKYIFLYFI